MPKMFLFYFSLTGFDLYLFQIDMSAVHFPFSFSVSINTCPIDHSVFYYIIIFNTVDSSISSVAMSVKYYHPDSAVLVDNYFQIPLYRLVRLSL